MQSHSVFGKSTLDVIQTCPEGMFILLGHLRLVLTTRARKNGLKIWKKKAVDVVQYGKQNPQAAFESGTLRNTALRI